MSLGRRAALWLACYFARIARCGVVHQRVFYIGNSLAGVNIASTAFEERDGWKRVELLIRTEDGVVDCMDNIRITEVENGPAAGLSLEVGG